MEMEGKKKRKTYMDYIKYIDTIKPDLVREREIVNGAEWKKVNGYFRQMKKLGFIIQTPTRQNNWTLTTSDEFSLYILKYEGVDFDEMKEEILKDLEEDEMEGNLEEEDTKEEEIDWSKLPKEKQELYKKIMERVKQYEEEMKNKEDFFDMMDRIKGEKLSKQRIKRIETFLGYLEWLESVKDIFIKASEIRTSKKYAVIDSAFRKMKVDGKVIDPPSSKNDWTITFSDSFLESEKLKENSKILSATTIPDTSKAPIETTATAGSNDTIEDQNEFLKLSQSLGLTLAEAEDYWKHKDDEDEEEE